MNMVMLPKKSQKTVIFLVVFIILGVIFPVFCTERYFITVAYYMLMYILLALSWNMLGGYMGYVNFGSSGFFGIGAYLAALLINNGVSQIFIHILVGFLFSGLLGLFLGLITLRIRGVYFSIATLALSVVLHMVVINTPELGGSLGMFIVTPKPPAPYPTFTAFIFSWLVGLGLILIIIANYIEKGPLGKQLTAIRDDELAAECLGIPTLKRKLLAAFISCAFMGAVGGLYPYYIAYLEPYTIFSLEFSINPIAMSIIGGTQSWMGPIVGGIIVSGLQQYLSATISSSLSLLVTGVTVLLVIFFIPKGVVATIRRGKS